MAVKTAVVKRLCRALARACGIDMVEFDADVAEMEQSIKRASPEERQHILKEHLDKLRSQL